MLIVEDLADDDFKGALGPRLPIFDIAAIQTHDDFRGGVVWSRGREHVLVTFQALAL
jgi:hypothetical protein